MLATRSSVLALFLTATVPVLYAQNPDADTKAYQNSCRITEMTLNMREMHREPGDPPAEDDEFTAAGKACAQLQAALAADDSTKAKNASVDLRPLLAVLGMPPTSPREQFAAMEKKAAGMSREDLFDALPDLAKRAFEAGEMERAQKYSEQLLQIASQYPKDWNYGNAIFYGNFVLGRISLRRGDLKRADQYLLAAGGTPGSPQLNSFGPNMTLARDLLEKGESAPVLQYLEMCKKFWELGQQQLNGWSSDIRDGKAPDFSSNLNY
jgi:hypothetical protein